MKILCTRFPLRVSIVLLTLTLSACTPAPYHYIAVEKIGVSNNMIYVRASQHCSYSNECESGLVYYSSKNFGQAWNEITPPTKEIEQLVSSTADGQSPECLSGSSKICFRITGREEVEISNDGGATWRVDWQIPVGRKLYMERRAFGLTPDTIPLDIQTIESSNGDWVIVALGNQGVLVRSLDGNWNRYAVGTAIPIPYEASSFREALEVLNYSEFYLSIFLAILCLLVFSVCAWITIFMKSETELKNGILRSLSLIALLLMVLVFLCLVIRAPALIFFFLCVSFMVTWFVFLLFAPKILLVALALLLSIGFSAIFFFAFLFPYQLWALGTIPVYETARTAAWFVGIVVLLAGFMAEMRISALAVKPLTV